VVTHQDRWHEASAEIRLALLSGAPLAEAVGLITSRLAKLLDASAVAMFACGDATQVVVGEGDAAGLAGVTLESLPTPAEEAVRTARVVQARWPGSGRAAGPLDEPFADRPLLVAPVILQGRVHSLLLAAGHHDFAPRDVALIQSLADQAAMAMELTRAREDQELLLLASERDRIARDLHDLVIQRLFAAGMGLQSVVRLIDDQRAADRVGAVVEALDDTILELRNSIFLLSQRQGTDSGLRGEVMRLVEEAADNLAFRIPTRFDGPVDSTVPQSLTPHVLAVVREALSNIVRHAQASTVRVEVSAGDDLVVAVADDGVGLPPSGRRSGLANLRTRAEALDGSLDVITRPEHPGTLLRWCVPLARSGS
jgi:signal transduction histidine kinase